jgi:hypothetical protein
MPTKKRTNSQPSPPPLPVAPGIPPATRPQFRWLFPDFSRLPGFRARHQRWQKVDEIPGLPEGYRGYAPLPPRSRVMEWFEDLRRWTLWDRTAALVDCVGLELGDFDDLVELQLSGRYCLQRFVDSPRGAFQVDVITFRTIPGLDVRGDARHHVDGSDRRVPVLDLRGRTERWEPPFEAQPGWGPGEWHEHALPQIPAIDFCRQLDSPFVTDDECEQTLSRSVMAFCWPADRDTVDAVLDRLIQAMWDAMRVVSALRRWPLELPVRPPSAAPTGDRFFAAFDGLQRWITAARSLQRPVPVSPAQAGNPEAAALTLPAATAQNAVPDTTERTAPPRRGDLLIVLFGKSLKIVGLGEEGVIQGLDGAVNLFRLVESRGRPVPLIDLIPATLTGIPDALLGQRADPRSTQPAYEKQDLPRLRADIDRLRDEVESAADDVERADSQRALEKAEEELQKAMGLGGRGRDLNDVVAKHRPRIHGRLNTVYARMRASNMKNLAAHFKKSIRAQGGAFVYEPETHFPSWRTEKSE